ncbi:ABC transporter permease [Sinorhizobium medicae]|uniref:Binding-protein-dependent transport systems inner membrane component n=1 Tax=Sinorhizobium medicae TaxID=110321 RepID=A0A508X871_9HYPH|nr:ABC transporter permease [Sinorhizobium medicae]MDX0524394.1 ABC transporter permease subunit [Sinorhizobium medicae]MDX0636155.1 ABC transporter permease subunit [Sinorhizobium medicae]MDX0695792.1 ABC transporter permease subunit [Sinorhizobium medicae]MDX0745152.1 ABC transporter permease subunit [Sinorhizobium medicae]MDX0770020.1 ABC transporter permease subunit [Sinorhizobium medicae]
MSINTQSVLVMETGPAVSPLNSGGKVVTLEAAGQWTLIRQRFLRHKIAAFAAGIILVLYLIGAFAEFLAPGLPNASRPQYTFAPPQRISLFTHTDNAGTRFLPHVKGYKIEIEPKALRRSFVVDEAKIIPIGFFVKGAPYKLWGVIPMETHLVGPLDAREPMYLLGSDRLGRDLMSRLIYGTRVSMSIGLVGVAISLTLGVVMGAVSGYYGGWVDTLIQRIIEIVSAMPTIPLWLGLAAAIPLSWSPLSVYFMVTLIVSLLSWTGLAREVRGRFFALRGDDFVTAARLDGAGERRIIFRHILPSLTSHILAVVTLAIPTMIVAETSLSFLGVGLKPPVVSWGVLLQDAQNVRTVATAPWLLIWPSLAVVLAVLSFNFFGDGLRDAADPYDT